MRVGARVRVIAHVQLFLPIVTEIYNSSDQSNSEGYPQNLLRLQLASFEASKLVGGFSNSVVHADSIRLIECTVEFDVCNLCWLSSFQVRLDCVTLLTCWIM